MINRSGFLVTEEGRQCSRCGAFKLWSAFNKNKHGTRGRQSWCIDCFREHEGRQKAKIYAINEEGRECSTCGEFKAWEEFHLRRDLSTGHMSRCKACVKQNSATGWVQRRMRDYDLKRKYGISLVDYEGMQALQNGVCAICGNPEASEMHGKVRFMSVDHDHETGKVRALLCHSCNVMLGAAKEDTSILESGIEYLKRHCE